MCPKSVCVVWEKNARNEKFRSNKQVALPKKVFFQLCLNSISNEVKKNWKYLETWVMNNPMLIVKYMKS